MNKILITAAASTLGSRSYESPAATVLEILTEGLMCMSGQLEGWSEDELDL
jgi:hypothetical protein